MGFVHSPATQSTARSCIPALPSVLERRSSGSGVSDAGGLWIFLVYKSRRWLLCIFFASCGPPRVDPYGVRPAAWQGKRIAADSNRADKRLYPFLVS